MLYIALIILSVALIYAAYGIGQAEQWKKDVTCMDYNELLRIVGDKDITADVWDYHFERMIKASPKD